MSKTRVRILFAVTTIVLLGVAQNLPAQFRGPRDPGVRGGTAGAGGMLAGLNADEQEMFRVGRADFNEAEEVGLSRQGIARPRSASSLSRSSSVVRAEIPPGTVQKISNSRPSGSLA